jgi:hypothetical protein
MTAASDSTGKSLARESARSEGRRGGDTLALAVATGETPIRSAVAHANMVVQTERDEMTWYKCEACGLMFDDRSDATQHEENCDAEEPTYIQ